MDANTSLVAPSEEIEVGMTGRNDSIVDVPYLRLRWIETVEWTASARTEQQSRNLVDLQIPTRANPPWTARLHAAQGKYSAISDDKYGEMTRIARDITLPRDARDSYPGMLIDVRHVLSVTAVTVSCCTTEPETSVMVQVQRKSPMVTATSIATGTIAMETDEESQAALAAYVSDGGEEPMFAAAEVLQPQEWQPQEADVVVLSAASATVLPSSTDDAEQGPTPTAPTEDAVFGTTYPSTLSSDLLYLQSLLIQHSDDPLDFLHNQVLNDPFLVTRLSNLTPPEYVGLLQGLVSYVPQVARALAFNLQPNFSCRHVLATLWGLPSPIRFDVLKEIAPLANDLETEQSMIERELSESELIHFRAALRVHRKDVRSA
jgi:hypothetical protein